MNYQNMIRCGGGGIKIRITFMKNLGKNSKFLIAVNIIN
jgi:hypothetical protein